jgi:hypothetical protein
MLARSFRPRAVAIVGTLAITACASSTPPGAREYVAVARVPSLTPTSRVLDAERIRRSGAQTAWDAIRMLVPSYRFRPSRGLALRMFGPPGARPHDPSIRLVIDGHRIADPDALKAIPAEEIIAIHLLNETEAATYLGPSGEGGAIVVQTRFALRRQ